MEFTRPSAKFAITSVSSVCLDHQMVSQARDAEREEADMGLFTWGYR